MTRHETLQGPTGAVHRRVEPGARGRRRLWRPDAAHRRTHRSDALALPRRAADRPRPPRHPVAPRRLGPRPGPSVVRRRPYHPTAPRHEPRPLPGLRAPDRDLDDPALLWNEHLTEHGPGAPYPPTTRRCAVPARRSQPRTAPTCTRGFVFLAPRTWANTTIRRQVLKPRTSLLGVPRTVPLPGAVPPPDPTLLPDAHQGPDVLAVRRHRPRRTRRRRGPGSAPRPLDLAVLPHTPVQRLMRTCEISQRCPRYAQVCSGLG